MVTSPQIINSVLGLYKYLRMLSIFFKKKLKLPVGAELWFHSIFVLVLHSVNGQIH
jgi:hypothetical protein